MAAAIQIMKETVSRYIFKIKQKKKSEYILLKIL